MWNSKLVVKPSRVNSLPKPAIPVAKIRPVFPIVERPKSLDSHSKAKGFDTFKTRRFF